jgi:hypothetical protein
MEALRDLYEDNKVKLGYGHKKIHFIWAKEILMSLLICRKVDKFSWISLPIGASFL